MKDIIKIEIELTGERFRDSPWQATIHNPVFNIQKSFRLLPDALAWAIKEVVKE